MSSEKRKPPTCLNKKTGKLYHIALFLAGIWLPCAIITMALPALPASASDDSIDAVVTVNSSVNESYGAAVTAAHYVWPTWRALGEPDKRAALIFRRGWIIIELENTITDCQDISIWAARVGWKSPHFKVYASSDGINWDYVGNGKCKSRRYTRFDFSGTYGDVRYIKVERNQAWSWSTMALDAVWAKGGGA